MTRGFSPWRALAQSGISVKWEDPRPSGRGVCQIRGSARYRVLSGLGRHRTEMKFGE